MTFSLYDLLIYKMTLLDCPNDRSFTAPETYVRKAFPSEAALEKVIKYYLLYNGQK